MATYRSIRDFVDWPMLLLALAISALGILQIYSATHDTIWRDAWWKQIVWIGGGLFLFWLVSLIDYHSLLSHIYWLYGGSVVLLVAVFVVGAKVFGSKRWIPLAFGFKFQVSEFVKIVLILLVARYLAGLKRDELEWPDLLKVGGLVLLPMALVMKQPDLGTSLTYTPILLMGIFLAGLRWQYWAVIGIAAALILPMGWFILKDYQRARLTTFLDPARDPQGQGYQVIQSKIAVGAGGMWGKGVTRGTQTQLQFLPVPHTDFIFSAFSEEHGFLAVVVVLGWYFFLLMQIVQNAQTAPDKAGMYICMGVAALFLFHVLVNVGMVVGRMPVTGIPLPLMSAGGSHVLSVFMLLGLVNNVRLRRFVN
ncbi:MAG TPA: rod shape-determining protein RodA [Bryobacteraceae bacterium]|jgi:rod shape determining protein RodA|nr:rod shape-determining protein RodA [Bryobacteraceae bacterium]